MTNDLIKLADALRRDTSDKRLEQEIEDHTAEIKAALNSGQDYILHGPPSFIVQRHDPRDCTDQNCLHPACGQRAGEGD